MCDRTVGTSWYLHICKPCLCVTERWGRVGTCTSANLAYKRVTARWGRVTTVRGGYLLRLHWTLSGVTTRSSFPPRITMLCGLSRRLSKSFSRSSRAETKKKEKMEKKKRPRRRSLDDLSVEIMADFSSATIYDDDQDPEVITMTIIIRDIMILLLLLLLLLTTTNTTTTTTTTTTKSSEFGYTRE